LGKEVMNRRSFFKFLPVAPVVLIIEGARAATVDQAPDHNIMTLTPLKKSDYKPDSLRYWMSENDMSRELNISVGQDGKLWIRSKNDVWKRVLTE
jgi:hypothetical protein